MTLCPLKGAIMLRFIFSFIFFGLLFYAMYVYTPDAFHVLQTTAAKIFEFFTNLVHQFMPAHAAPVVPPVPPA